MTMPEGAQDGARVRWLVAGSFTATPTGKRHAVGGEAFATLLAESKLEVTATVPDRLGDGAERTFTVGFNKLKSFTLAEVIGAVPLLADLRALGEALGSTDLSKRPEADAAVARVLELCGSGKLAQDLAKAVAPPKPASAPTAAASVGVGGAPGASGGDAVEALFAQVGVETPAQAGRAAIDSFIRAVRSQTGNKPKVNTAQGRDARGVLEAAVYGTASDLLKAAPVAKLEAAWRGLKLLLDQCPHSSGMRVEVLDIAPEGVVDALSGPQEGDAIDQPDAVVVVDPIDDAELLTKLAAAAEAMTAPIIASVGPGLFGVATAEQVPTRIEEDGAMPEAWAALRSDESSRWLSVTFNRVVAVSDGAGAMRRAVFASSSLAVAAMLATSYRLTGAFGRIQGPAGALRAPGTHELTQGKDAGTAVPTEVFLSVRAQSKLAQLGVLGLGSGRNSDAVTITHAPTVRGGEDLVPLPAQVLTGRIVRFAQWVREQVPAGTSDADVLNMFEQAAGVFLFPGMAEGAKLSARLADDKEGGRVVIVNASMRAELAGAPFQLAFSLPLLR